MNNVTPYSVAAGTTQYANVNLNETFCRSIPSAATLSITITPTVGAVTTANGVTIAPVKLLVNVTYPTCVGGCTKSYQFTEDIVVGATGEATAFTISASNITYSLKGVQCCRAKGIEINALLTIASTAA